MDWALWSLPARVRPELCQTICRCGIMIMPTPMIRPKGSLLLLSQRPAVSLIDRDPKPQNSDHILSRCAEACVVILGILMCILRITQLSHG